MENNFVQYSETEKEILHLDDLGRKLMLAEDINAIAKIYSPDVIVNAPFNAVTESAEDIFRLVRSGFIKLSEFTIKPEKVIVKNNVAVSMGGETITFDANSTNPNAGKTIHRRYTHVYLKTGDNWWLIARHANEICG